MARLTDETIAELRRLNGERTPGPWKIQRQTDVDSDWDGTCYEVLLQAEIFTGTGGYLCAIEGDNEGAESNARFIAASVNAIIPALDEVERLRAIEAAARIVQAHYQGVGYYPTGRDALDAALLPAQEPEGGAT